MSSAIRYGKLFKPARKVAKHVLSGLYPVVVRAYQMPEVLSIDETLDAIIESKGSIARFGDSEFLYIIDKLNLPYQSYDDRLAEKLKVILRNMDERVFVGLPIGYHSHENLTKRSRLTWRSQIAWIYPRLKKYLNLERPYYNASMTRIYMDYRDKSACGRYIAKLKQIWQDRDVVLIEGEKSRLGAGNDLFEGAKGVKRILAPAHHAFAHYDELLSEARRQDSSVLFLIALGPTATALAYDLARDGYQAVDVGNVDIEYEWFRMGAETKVKIPGKYTSEAVGGRIVENIDDSDYEGQVVARVL
jgi:glycosyltransferase family protein